MKIYLISASNFEACLFSGSKVFKKYTVVSVLVLLADLINHEGKLIRQFSAGKACFDQYSAIYPHFAAFYGVLAIA